ncbi:MAG: hypothetical protein AB7H97_03725 [Pseudobdellovibrionaceae bacterium]
MKNILFFFIFCSSALANEQKILIQAPDADTEEYLSYLQTHSQYSSPVQYQTNEINRDLSFSLKWTPVLREVQLSNQSLDSVCSEAFKEAFQKPLGSQDLETLSLCSWSFKKSSSPQETEYLKNQLILEAQEKNKSISNSLPTSAWDFKKMFPAYSRVLINGHSFDLSQKSKIFLLSGVYQVILLSNSAQKIEHWGTLGELEAKQKNASHLISGSCISPDVINIPISYLHKSEGFYGEECVAAFNMKLKRQEVLLNEISPPTKPSFFKENSWVIPLAIVVGAGAAVYFQNKDVSFSLPF